MIKQLKNPADKIDAIVGMCNYRESSQGPVDRSRVMKLFLRLGFTALEIECVLKRERRKSNEEQRGKKGRC